MKTVDDYNLWAAYLHAEKNAKNLREKLNSRETTRIIYSTESQKLVIELPGRYFHKAVFESIQDSLEGMYKKSVAMTVDTDAYFTYLYQINNGGMSSLCFFEVEPTDNEVDSLGEILFTAYLCYLQQ